MNSKFLEIRDSNTTIVVLAIKTAGETAYEHKFFRRGGWGKDTVILMNLNAGTESTHDPFVWWQNGNNTLFQAHFHIQSHFDSLENYSVLDIEFINGKTKEPKTSEILNSKYDNDFVEGE